MTGSYGKLGRGQEMGSWFGSWDYPIKSSDTIGKEEGYTDKV